MKRQFVIALILGAALPVMAASAAQDRPSRLTEAERAQCLAHQGQITIAGFSGREICALPYADGGRRCIDGSQCDGDCMFEGNAVRPRRNARISGVCERYRYAFGCRTTITNGRISGGICVD